MRMRSRKSAHEPLCDGIAPRLPHSLDLLLIFLPAFDRAVLLARPRRELCAAVFAVALEERWQVGRVHFAVFFNFLGYKSAGSGTPATPDPR